jgi:hypothetical protein
LFTGINSAPSRAAALAALASLLLGVGTSQAQSVKLRVLTIPSDVQAGSWISYRIQVDSKNRPPRRFTQRLAVVAREGAGDEAGAWLELKTIEAGRTRIERGFFARGDRGHSQGAGTPNLVLRRYQSLTPDGRLIEYPVGEEGGPMPDEDISAMDLLEFTGTAKIDSLPSDTLSAGSQMLPCRVVRVTRYGKDQWAAEDTTFVNRAVMTRTVWRNPAVPVTGYARSVLEVATARLPTISRRAAAAPPETIAALPMAPDSLATSSAAADSIALDSASRVAPPVGPEGQRFFYRAEVTLVDVGNDAVPEITQAAEAAPEDAPRPKPKVIR